jgi:hypothetical protein
MSTQYQPGERLRRMAGVVADLLDDGAPTASHPLFTISAREIRMQLDPDDTAAVDAWAQRLGATAGQSGRLFDEGSARQWTEYQGRGSRDGVQIYVWCALRVDDAPAGSGLAT